MFRNEEWLSFEYLLCRENYSRSDETGNSKYTKDGDVTVAAGDPNANIILGISTGIEAGKLNFSMNWNGAFGHQLYNNTAMSVLPIGNLGRNLDANLLEGSIKESIANPITSSSRYIEDGDFVKLANATLSYNIGKSFKTFKRKVVTYWPKPFGDHQLQWLLTLK